jgi:hypothetical protein
MQRCPDRGLVLFVMTSKICPSGSGRPNVADRASVFHREGTFWTDEQASGAGDRCPDREPAIDR